MSNLKRFLALTLAMLMVVGAMVTVSAKSFEDVAASDAAYQAVDILSELGVVVGATETEFNPDALVERQQMAMFIARLATAQPALFAGEAGAIFADQTAPVYNAAIQYAYTNGIIAGRTATTFDGAATVTLQEAAAMLSRALGYGNKTNNASYPYSYMVIGSEIGLLAGLEDVAPTAALTRGEVAIMLYNALFAPKADRELLYTPDGQDFIVTIPEEFTDGNDATPYDTLAVKAWKCTVTTGAYINATQKAAIGTADITTATKSIADPVTLNKTIPQITNRYSFAALSKYFAEDVTANDMLGVELKIMSRAGKILKIDVVGSKTVTTNVSYNKDTNVLTVDETAYTLTQYLGATYPSESDNCFYHYVGNKIVRNVPGNADAVDTAYAQIAVGFFKMEVINAGLDSQMIVYMPYSFGKVVADSNADGVIEISAVGNITTNTISAVADDYVAYFNGGNLNVDLVAKAVKSDASKAVVINNTASTATLANGTVIPTGVPVVSGATFAVITLNSEYHVFTVDGKIISTVAKDAPAATYAPKAYYKVLAVQADAFAGTYRAKVVSNTGAESTINVTEINGVAFPTANLNDINTKIITIDGTKVYTFDADSTNFVTSFNNTYDVVYSQIDPETDLAVIGTLVGAANAITKDSNLFTIDANANDVSFVLNDFSKIVILGNDGKYATNSGKTLNGFESAQTLTNLVAVIRVNKAGVNELAYLYAQSSIASTAVFTGAQAVTSSNLYLFLSENEISTDAVKYKAFKLSTGAVEEVTYTKAGASADILAAVGANKGSASKVYDVKSSDAVPAAYAYAESTTFKLSSGFVVTADKIYTANGVKYYQWNGAPTVMNYEAKTLDKFVEGKSYTGIIVKNGNNVDYVIVGADASIDASLTSILTKTDVTPGVQTGADAGNAIEWDISVLNAVNEVTPANIAVAAGATVKLYSDAGFTAEEDTIALADDDLATVYVKVTAQDFTTVKYYVVAITTAAA